MTTLPTSTSVRKVGLENVKSYGTLTEIPVDRGMTAVLGENGSGKSSVLEAVGYALFDFLSPYTQEDFIRDGADYGRVKVDISVNGEVFTVERYVGRAIYRVLKDGEEVVAQKQNVTPWIRDKLGIPPALDLGTLWNASIGVPQGELTLDFVRPPAKRRQAFDPVLQTVAYTDAWKEMREVEKIVEDEISDAEKKIKELEVRTEQLDEKLKEKEKMKKELQNLEELVYEDRKTLMKLQEKKEELEVIKSKIDKLMSELDSKKSDVEASKGSLSDAKKLVGEAKEAKKILDETEQRHREYTDKSKRKSVLEKRLEKKKGLEEPRFNITKKIAEFKAKKKSLKSSAKSAREAKKRIDSLKENASRQDELENKISNLKVKIGRLEESVSLLKDAKGAECPTCNQLLPDEQRKNVLHEHAKKKSKLSKSTSTSELELEKLGSPKSELEKARARYQDNKDAKKKLATIEDQIGKLLKKKEEIDSQLGKYESFENEVRSITNELGNLKGDHERYIGNKKLASKLQGRKKKAKKLAKKREKLQDEKKKIESKLARKEGMFDEKAYEKVSLEIGKFSSEVTRHETRISNHKERLRELIIEIGNKLEAKQELEEREEEKARLEKDLEFAAFVRRAIRDAQPLVTEVFIQKISEAASGIYQELRGRTCALEWTRDYQIIVHDGGEKKAFHKLSGGEQVCAALAVRLAVLWHLAPVGFAFLDEPTENLDDARKQNLASHLGSFEALGQLCVISHDRVFEGATDQVVFLENPGETKVMSNG